MLNGTWSMSREERLYLQDILDSIAAVREYTEGMTPEQFAADRKTVDAVVRNLEIIGEAAGELTPEVCADAPEIEWRKIVAMRNVLTHAYFGVSKPVVWDVVATKLGPLDHACKRLLSGRSRKPAR
jgi:uncharacterized protein with HEPN domain